MPRILVVGDSMLDRRVDCTVCRLSPEGYIPVHAVEQEHLYAGGAANVALNIKAMGGDVTLLTTLGHSTELRRIVVDADLDFLDVASERTTEKTRYYAGGIVRFRADNDYVLRPEVADSVLDAFDKLWQRHDYVVFSDYGKGALLHVDRMLSTVGGTGVTIVDPKGKDWTAYAGATIIKANAQELADASDTYHSSAEMFDNLLCSSIICTQGEGGSWLYRNGEQPTHFRPHRVQAVDPTGAGDSYLAALAVSLWEGNPLPECLRRASVAGALAVTHHGTAVITRKEIFDALRT